VPLERKKIHFDFPSCNKVTRRARNQARQQGVGDLVVFKKLDLGIERGDRIALVGPNGVENRR
jgi:ATPase subunit of ABC transporter with duplicated ATPase domains